MRAVIEILGLDERKLASMIESTLLEPRAQRSAYVKLAEEAREYGFRCIVVPPLMVGLFREVRVCSVAGFPWGLSSLRIKLMEVEEAMAAGASEIDLVPNLSEPSEEEICAVADAVKRYGGVLKVITEAPLLSDEELERLTELAKRCGAQYVKTSTGVYSKGGDPVTVHRLASFAAPRGLRVKASGGIRSVSDALLAIAAGASIIGTSSAGAILRELRRLIGESARG